MATKRDPYVLAGQVGVLRKNLSAVMEGSQASSTYDGYTSCPLVTGNDLISSQRNEINNNGTGYSKCILAEFDYDGVPLETFPIDQGKERRTMFHLKKDFMPDMYWHGLLK